MPEIYAEYEYQCSNGHAMGGRVPITRCPAVVHGSPCKGTLKRIGHGSRKEKASGRR